MFGSKQSFSHVKKLGITQIEYHTPPPPQLGITQIHPDPIQICFPISSKNICIVQESYWSQSAHKPLYKRFVINVYATIFV